MTEQILSPLLQDREITRKEVAKAVQIGIPIVEGSNLVGNEQITKEDAERTKKLLQAVAPIDINNYRVHAHLQLTSEFARKIGEGLKANDPSKYSDLNLEELEVLGLLHDVGRLFTHRWHRNELVERHFLKQLGIRQDIIDKITGVDLYIAKDPNNPDAVRETTEGLSLSQKIIETADLYGKRKPNGKILTFEEVMEYHNKSRANYEELTGLHPVWASERRLNPDVIAFSEKVYRTIHNDLGDKGVDLEEIRQDILQNEKESPIKAVVFDVGNVLIPNPDPQTLEDIQRVFNIDSGSALSAWNNLIPPMQQGEITEEAFWKLFKKGVNREQAVGFEPLFTRYLARRVTPEVAKIVEEVKDKGYVTAVLSDVIPPQGQALESSGLYNGFDFRILSFDIKTTKKREEAFIIAALRLGLPPQACFFIDDKQEYIDRAKNIGMKGAVFQNPEQLEQTLRNQSIL